MLTRFRSFLGKSLKRRGRTPPRVPQAFLTVEGLELRIVPDAVSVGPPGIDARGLGATLRRENWPDINIVPGGLTGAGVPIGQVDHGRPAKHDFDNAFTQVHPNVNPERVFLRDGPAVRFRNVDDDQGHAEWVAGVMIARGNIPDTGVAPNATLHAAALPDTTPAQYVLTLQNLARLTNPYVPAINHSILLPGVAADGTSFYTRAVDWMAERYSTLVVVGGTETGVAASVPADNYNGLTVGMTQQDANGVYRVWNPDNTLQNVNPGDRRWVDLVAPGEQINVPDLGTLPAGGGPWSRQSGTSLAAPHVTGTIALLQQFEREARSQAPLYATFWDAHRPEVMRAVLMNSADKIQDEGNGLRLGMSKTIVHNGQPIWPNSDARDAPNNDPAGRPIPLDLRIGTGQLNARRALIQLQPGQQLTPEALPNIGWTYHSSFRPAGQATFSRDYVISTPLLQSSYLSATLAWNSRVRLIDNPGGTLGRFDHGEALERIPLMNLDLELYQKNAAGQWVLLWASNSATDNVEHIFYQLPATGDYKLRVVGPWNFFRTSYALAWWGLPAPPAGARMVQGTAWNDQDGDGIQDAGEAGIADVGVDLFDVSGRWVGYGGTDAMGNYQITVGPGNYSAVFRLLHGYAFSPQDQGGSDLVDSDVNASGMTALFQVGATADVDMDAGLMRLAGVQGAVWNDADGDGIQEAGEAPLGGYRVSLYTDAGALVGLTNTDDQGDYRFFVSPGSYKVQFDKPANFIFTLKDQGSDDTVDSDAASTGWTDSFTIAQGQLVSNVDAGLTATAPMASSDYYTVAPGQTLVGAAPGVLGNDDDFEGDALLAVLVSGPLHGTLSLASDGSFQYTPNAGYVGLDEFTYHVVDAVSVSGTAWGFITVADLAPTAGDDYFEMTPDATLSLPLDSLLLNDYDVEGNPLTASLVAGPTHGTLVWNTGGPIQYTPNAGYSGVDSFTYKVNDGQSDSNVALVELLVSSSLPGARNDAYSVVHDRVLNVPVTSGLVMNDIGIDAELIFVFAVNENFDAVGTNLTLPSGAVVNVQYDGSFTYTPPAGFVGTDSFSYIAVSAGVESTAQVVITVTNQAPALNSLNNHVVGEGATVFFTAQATDPDGDAVTYSLDAGAPAGASINPTSGYFTFTPTDNGVWTITVRATDPLGLSATRSFTVTSNNLAPTAQLFASGLFKVNQPVHAYFANQYDPGSADTFVYSFDFNNDGDFIDPGDKSLITNSFADYTYTTIGSKTIHARIQDDDGGYTDYWLMIMITM